MSFGFGLATPQILARARPVLPLDGVNAFAAYSTRKLRTAYTGPCMRVRETDGNTEADIGFRANVLNGDAVAELCGENSGFVTTWYDQSGNGRNITQSTNAQQPCIYDAGALIANVGSNGRAGISFTSGGGANVHNLRSAVITQAQPFTVFSALRTGTLAAYSVLFDGNISSTGVRAIAFLQRADLSPARAALYGGNLIAISLTGLASNTNFTIRYEFNDDASRGSVNGTVSAVDEGGSTGIVNGFLIGGDFDDAAVRTNSTVGEVIILPSVLSANAALSIEREQGTYFGISVS